ncbi:MAG: hypothetical protein WDN46_09280 [Methylocella sp.]
MTERWFKFTAIGREDEYGFGTMEEALELGGSRCTPYLLDDAEVLELDLPNRQDELRIRDALAARRDALDP